MEVYARTGFLLLCITTFVPRTIEILRMHTLTLPLENLKLQMAFACVCVRMLHYLHVGWRITIPQPYTPADAHVHGSDWVR